MKMPSNVTVEGIRYCFITASEHERFAEEGGVIDRVLLAWQHVADRDARLKAWATADRLIRERKENER